MPEKKMTRRELRELKQEHKRLLEQNRELRHKLTLASGAGWSNDALKEAVRFEGIDLPGYTAARSTAAALGGEVWLRYFPSIKTLILLAGSKP